MEDDTVLRSPNLKEEGEEGEKEENILIFLDSLDNYLTLVDSLTSTLRKGWLDLASARHSMGASRISSSHFDLKVQSAATTVQVSKSIKESQSELHYTLSKWGSFRDNREDVREMQKCNAPQQLRHRGSSQLSDSQHTHIASGNGSSSVAVDNSIQKERSKALAVFGALVSPKLRSAQVSFETALETVVEIANMRSLMLSAFSQLQKEEVAQIENNGTERATSNEEIGNLKPVTFLS